MYQLNDMAFYMLHFLRIKASVNIFNVNIKLKMPPTRLERLSSAVNVKLLAIKDSNDEDKENNIVKSLLEQVSPVFSIGF